MKPHFLFSGLFYTAHSVDIMSFKFQQESQIIQVYLEFLKEKGRGSMHFARGVLWNSYIR